MGTRYIIEVECPECGILDDGVYYAPTCGFTTHECACGHVTDLEEHTGISHEDASNAAEIERLVCAAGSGFQKQERAAETGA